MRRVIGFALFFIAVGMMFIWLLPNLFMEIVCMIAFLLLGYNFFCCN